MLYAASAGKGLRIDLTLQRVTGYNTEISDMQGLGLDSAMPGNHMIVPILRGQAHRQGTQKACNTWGAWTKVSLVIPTP